MEAAFDGFFEKHRLKLHQYLQLLRYERRFQEVRLRPPARVSVRPCSLGPRWDAPLAFTACVCDRL